MSIVVAVLVAFVVLGIWYPEPFRTFSGGLYLFFILTAVDVCLGPLATAVVSKPEKSVKEWRMDVSLIVLLQLLALSYGFWTMYQARPVYLAFEIDRMRVVHAVDVSPQLLSRAPKNMQSLPLYGPKLIAVRSFSSEIEKAEATMAALQGVELGFRPDFWIPYDSARADVLLASKSLNELLTRKPSVRTQLDLAVKSMDLPTGVALRYLPLHGRSEFWTVLIDADNAKPLAYLPLDPY